MQALAWCLLGLLLGLSPALAQNKTYSKQRKYVTTHKLPATEEIPVAPEGLPDPGAAAEPAPAPPAAVDGAVVAAPAVAPVPAQPAPPAPLVAPAPYPTPPPVYPGYAQGPAPAPPHPGWLPAPAPAPTVVPPPGYVLVPIPPAPQPPTIVQQDEARRAWVVAQLAQVDQQLLLLKRERKSIAGPVVQMVLGYAGTLVCGAVALGSYGAAESIEQDPWHDGYHYDEQDEERLRHTAYAFTGLTAVALAVGIGGTVRLVRNSANNKLLNVERRSLLAQRTSLRQQLTYGASVLPGQLQIGVRGHF
ncbi:MAG TPA: hypothetical protein VFZ61_30665 [Polyangiales bacterium]